MIPGRRCGTRFQADLGNSVVQPEFKELPRSSDAVKLATQFRAVEEVKL